MPAVAAKCLPLHLVGAAFSVECTGDMQVRGLDGGREHLQLLLVQGPLQQILTAYLPTASSWQCSQQRSMPARVSIDAAGISSAASHMASVCSFGCVMLLYQYSARWLCHAIYERSAYSTAQAQASMMSGLTCVQTLPLHAHWCCGRLLCYI